MNEITGKTVEITFEGRTLRYLNQKSPDWTHPYQYLDGKETLKSAGCGIFSVAHAVEWMSGIRIDCEELADFSVATGGRGDDGTDRPVLLGAMMEHGLAAKFGFAYDFGGLRNDHQLLWAHMSTPGNTALCNLRVGHIVALLAAREVNGQRQYLAIDSVAESRSEKIRDRICECVDSSLVSSFVRNQNGLIVGREEQHALFWVEHDLPIDFNLLARVPLESSEASLIGG